MVTNTHPIDYQKTICLVPQLVPVCAECGGRTYLRPADNARACMDCGSTKTVEVWETMLETFRRGLADLARNIGTAGGSE